MSDTPQGDGWWQTSDGKWHPPEYDPTAPGDELTETAQGTDPAAGPPQWSPTGGTADQPQQGLPQPVWGEQPPAPAEPPPPPYADENGHDQTPAPGGSQATPGASLFGDREPDNHDTPGGPDDDSGPFGTTRPGEFGLPSEPKRASAPKVVRPSVIPSSDGPSGGGGSGPSRFLVLSGVVAAVLLVLFAGWYFLLRSDGSDEGTAKDTASSTEPTVAGESTVSETEESTSTTAPTTGQLPPKPTIAAGERLPVLEFNGSGNSTVALDPPGPRVANVEYSGTGPFKVTGIDANGNQVASFVESDGPYSGSVAVDFPDEQDSRSLSVEADGPWSIRMVPVESLTPLPGGFTGTGDDVVLYSGGIGPVTLSHSGSGPFKVNYFEIQTRQITTIADETGPFEGSVELRGPAFVWITADGDWSVTPG